jgi:tetratricopeptide (TPR) repeat protein
MGDIDFAALTTRVTVREGKEGDADADERLERGSSVGRYLILDVIGEGAMGVVYAAFDPELDRRVAIKLLQVQPTARANSKDAQAWLLREAQALGRLSHPNVVEVHDVGTLPGERVFIAMKLVTGDTLRDWLKQPRTWREVLAVLREAGAGLAAVHAAGLVHRDFKPSNVLVSAVDGRARLTDFGLARPDFELARVSRDAVRAADTPRGSDATMDPRSPLHQNLTSTGSLVGTPAYMAPEIYDGLLADARSDQFAFGVTLYEALYRMRPFREDQLAAYRTAPLVPRDPPPDTKVPRTIERTVRRAIAPDRAARFASMDALLAELALDPLRTRTRVLVGVSIAAALGGAAAAGSLLSHPGAAPMSAPARCTGIAGRLAGVWDAATKSGIEHAFAGKPSFAPRMFQTASTALDAYAAAWTAAAADNCEATQVRREQTQEVMALRQACLDDRLAELGAVTKLLVAEGANLVDKVDSAVWALEPVRRCANVAALRAPSQPAPEIAGKLAAVRARLASAKAQVSLGQYDRAIAGASSALDDALGASYLPLVAEAQYIRGAALMRAQNVREAASALDDAVWSALRSRRDEVAVHAALSQALVFGVGLAQPADARRWLSLGQAIAARLANERELDQLAFEIEGTVAGARGDMVEAVAAHHKALDLGEQIYGETSVKLWRSEHALAASYAKSGAWSDAIPHFERALALRVAAVGPDHPDDALVLSNLGGAYQHVGDLGRARAVCARALAIRDRSFGPSSPALIATLNNLADLARESGDLVAAMSSIERAKVIAAAGPGPKHPLYHTVVTTLGEIQLAAGRHADARRTLDELIALETANQSPVLPATLATRAELALGESKWSDALGFADRAIAGLEASGGKDGAELWRPLVARGRALVALRRPAQAKVALARAVEIATQAKIKPNDLAPARAALSSL